MKWFGWPRWLCLAVVAGLTGFGGVYGPWWQPSAQVQSIVEGLRAGSVYEAPNASGVVNAQRARQVIGDRAIVVVILDRQPLTGTGDHGDPWMTLCHQIAREITGSYIWVYATDGKGSYDGANCVCGDFPKSSKTTDQVSDFDLRVNIAAQLSARYRRSATDLTPELEEFVLTFDAEAAKGVRADSRQRPCSRPARRSAARACRCGDGRRRRTAVLLASVGRLGAATPP
jgi:hypothetical protein